MSTDDTPALMSVGNFAAHLGYARSYGHQLRDEGRLVLTDDGRVRVAESIARVRATEDPAKAGVKARHAAARAAGPAADASEPADDAATPSGPDARGFDYQGSRAKKEHFAAMEAEASYRARIGELLEASDVRAALADVMTVLRASLEGIAHRMAPSLAAEVDEAQVRAALGAEIRHALDSAADAMVKLAK